MTAFDALWPTILDVGRHTSTGGYRRYAWSDADLTLREWFSGCAATRGMDVEEDRNGNLWAWWMPPGVSGDPRGAFVTGSHLDSVPDGGAFDGPLGVVSAFAAVDIVRERGVVPTVPVAVVAFSDEEGARFGVACIGSQLSTGALSAEKACGYWASTANACVFASAWKLASAASARSCGSFMIRSKLSLCISCATAWSPSFTSWAWICGAR